MISLYKHFLNYFILLAITILCFSGMSQIWATLLKPTFISLSLSPSLYSKCWFFFVIILFGILYIFVSLSVHVCGYVLLCADLLLFQCLCVYSIYISFIWELGFWAVCGFSYCFCIGLWAVCFLELIVMGLWCLWGCVGFSILGFVQNGELGVHREWMKEPSFLHLCFIVICLQVF